MSQYQQQMAHAQQTLLRQVRPCTVCFAPHTNPPPPPLGARASLPDLLELWRPRPLPTPTDTPPQVYAALPPHQQVEVAAMTSERQNAALQHLAARHQQRLALQQQHQQLQLQQRGVAAWNGTN